MVSRIIGKKFNNISRAVDMLCLQLGVEMEYSFHVQTPWRFRENHTILLASRDIYEPYCENVPEDWQYDLVGRPDALSSAFDVRAKGFKSKMQNAVVEACRLSDVNDLIITFSNGVVFEQFMSCSRKDEAWRLIDRQNDEHIVCFGEGGTISHE